MTLYRELYFRHVYAKLQPTIDDRFQSYENICELFNYLLSRYPFACPTCPILSHNSPYKY